MKKLLAVIAATLLLTSCAAQVISSSPRTVIIKAPRIKIVEAQALADAECAKHQRFARLVRGNGTYLYDCVE